MFSIGCWVGEREDEREGRKTGRKKEERRKERTEGGRKLRQLLFSVNEIFRIQMAADKSD